MRAFAVTVMTIALAVGMVPGSARADPVLVYPGMQIRQGNNVCTLGFVDPVQRIAFSAGHCRGDGVVTDIANRHIGTMTAFQDNTPNGATVNTDQAIVDYEVIVLAPDVAVNDILPGGRVLRAEPGPLLEVGTPICHFGTITGESCGAVQRVNNGWFTMANGVISQKGDSGGPVYVITPDGTARIVGLFNSTWGDYPAAVSWQAATDHIRANNGTP